MWPVTVADPFEQSPFGPWQSRLETLLAAESLPATVPVSPAAGVGMLAREQTGAGPPLGAALLRCAPLARHGRPLPDHERAPDTLAVAVAEGPSAAGVAAELIRRALNVAASTGSLAVRLLPHPPAGPVLAAATAAGFTATGPGGQPDPARPGVVVLVRSLRTGPPLGTTGG